jgi:hypothetical protein
VEVEVDTVLQRFVLRNLLEHDRGPSRRGRSRARHVDDLPPSIDINGVLRRQRAGSEEFSGEKAVESRAICN